MSTAPHQPLPIAPELEAMYDALEALPEDLAAEMMAQFVYQIGRRMDELGWNQKTLAAKAGMRPSQLSRLLKADNTSLITIARVAHALDLALGALKLIPEEDLDLHTDEVAAFVRTESTDKTWWPTSRRTAQAWGRKQVVEPSFAEAPLPQQVPRPAEPSLPYAEGTEVGAFLRQVKARTPTPSGAGTRAEKARAWQGRRNAPRSRGTNPAAFPSTPAISRDLIEAAYEQCSQPYN